MEIIHLGHSAFRIKGKQTSLVMDPFDGSFVGFPFPKHISADIVTISHDHKDHAAKEEVEGNPYVVHGPGEYEIKGVSIIGISSFHDGKKGADRGKNTIYHIEVDGVNIVHLGDLGAMLSSADVDALDGVDILFIPVGGDVTLNASDAANLVSDIEPSIVIPMHYQTDKHGKGFQTLAPVADFLKAMGKEPTVVSKLVITKDKIPAERQVIVFE